MPARMGVPAWLGGAEVGGGCEWGVLPEVAGVRHRDGFARSSRTFDAVLPFGCGKPGDCQRRFVGQAGGPGLAGQLGGQAGA
jgi:hypothetical protein